MTMKCSFSYNPFVKFHGKKFLEPEHDRLYRNQCYQKVCYKGTALYLNELEKLKCFVEKLTETVFIIYKQDIQKIY